MDSEKRIEPALRTKVDRAGGWCVKLPASVTTGLPDRLVLMPKGKLYFVELKSEGKAPSPIQLAIHRRLRALGFTVYVISTFVELEDFMTKIKGHA